MSSVTFVVNGSTSARSPDGLPSHLPEFPLGTLKAHAVIGTMRDDSASVSLTAADGDVVVLHLEGAPSLVLHPEHASELIQAQHGVAAVPRGNSASTLQVPSSLAWASQIEPAAQRGLFDKVILRAISVVTGITSGIAADVTAKTVVKALDGQVNAGVYLLNTTFMESLKRSGTPVASVPAVPKDAPILVLIHGTFSNTAGTFGKLWSHGALVQRIFSHYNRQVYALEHATLADSPITNALMLAKKLPDEARLDLLTHSRGGLVAEVLARACSMTSVTAADLRYFDTVRHSVHRAELMELVALVTTKKIRVERLVRVACPARGTLLASNRLDAYISILKWSLEGAGIPVIPELVDFLGDVAKNRSDPETIPGLAAQMPDGPIVQWLNANPAPIPGQLRVVAGDVQGDSISSWIKTLLSDAFYWTDNDFVVQTSSMYGGASRAGGATFALDRSGAVSHFSYFSNIGTATHVVNGLTLDQPEGYRVIGPLSAAGKDANGDRGPAVENDPKRPVVFLLPGILGSNLQLKGERVWLGWRTVGGLEKLAYESGQTDIMPDGAISFTYEKLRKFLSASHHVIEFAFDWRKPMVEEARRLARAVEVELNLREATGQPVRLLAHSMGGLVARVMQLEQPAIWDRMLKRTSARVLMLGTPNGGSWAPMQVLSGDDTFGNALVAFGAPFKDHKARALMAAFPGFLQLQAGLLDPVHGLDRSSRWEEMAAMDREIVAKKCLWHNLKLQLSSFEWGIPPQLVLDDAVKLRQRLDLQSAEGKLGLGGSLIMVTGKADFTPAGYEYQPKVGLVYLDVSGRGDGRVTQASAMLPGVPCWELDCEHGSLPAEESAFAAYLELLEKGSTAKLSPYIEDRAGAAVPRSAMVPNRASRKASVGTPDTWSAMSSDNQMRHRIERDGPPLTLTILNGNVQFVRHPVVLGHYHSLLLQGAEMTMNHMIGGSMEMSIQMGHYPQFLKSHQVFLNQAQSAHNPLQLPRPQAVIVVGLGHEGHLKAEHLSHTVSMGVIAWAQRLRETYIETPESFEIASSLIGSGGSGMSAALSARAIAKGVYDANCSLRQNKWPYVKHLHLIEVYLDRATDAWQALGMLAASAPGKYVLNGQIASGTGALRRALASGYRSTSYDLLTVDAENAGTNRVRIVYTLDTKRAREEVRAQGLQPTLVDMLIKSASNIANNDPQLGRTLFKLLVPPEMETALDGTSDLQIQLNAATAAIPWELLDTRSSNRFDKEAPPWAIRVKLLRSLRTQEFAETVIDAGSDDMVLVIGEPACDIKKYPRLPGARLEAKAVAAAFATAHKGDRVKALIGDAGCLGPNFLSVITSMFERDWRIIHVAGHGVGRDSSSSGGVVLSDDTYFGPNEISTMRVVPALMFVNCCHLGAQDPSALLISERSDNYNRPEFAANVAEALIKKGVRCVIAAGWAVDDQAAQVFASTFYQHLIAGSRFIDAVALARSAAYKLGGNTWAAYQCYGDPNWTFSRDTEDKPPSMSMEEEFAVICSAPSLILALESVITWSRYQEADHTGGGAKVRYLDQRFGPQWGSVGAVAESFGLAYAEAHDLATAIRWYELALAAPDGSASIHAVEQLGHLRARNAWDQVQAVPKANVDSRAEAIRSQRVAIQDAIELLHKIKGITLSMERESLCASACKYLSMLEHLAGDRVARENALRAMERHCGAAEQVGRSGGNVEWYFPALSRIAADVAVNLGKPRWQGLDRQAVVAISSLLSEKIKADPDFCSVIGKIELDFYYALSEKRLSAELGAILKQVNNLAQRVTSCRWWGSVYDQFEFMWMHCERALKKDPAELAAFVEIRVRLLMLNGSAS